MNHGSSAIQILYRDGTLILEGFNQHKDQVNLSSNILYDPRTQNWRSAAYQYQEIISMLQSQKLDYSDTARKYDKKDFSLVKQIIPRTHQLAALEAWDQSQRRGVISLPTGAGKTILALMAIEKVKRPTLIIVPTIDLLLQWVKILEEFFMCSIGRLGGGDHLLEAITVATYDSAAIHASKLGNQFGFLICDECHHLPAPIYKIIALSSIAPYRMGLSATPERADGQENVLYDLLGSLCFKGYVQELVENTLSPYDVVSIQVPLSKSEREQYVATRKIYTSFIQRNRINMSSREGWIDFIKKCSYMPGGKDAMRAYREQKKMAQANQGKLGEVWRILMQHRQERIIIFTEDNSMAYRIGSAFLLPVLTHHTKTYERKKFLDAFRQGEIDVLVTSKVLNEGVDVPEASIGIIVSGSGGVREHVQRLGRILRKSPGKKAVLYELVSQNTSEVNINLRRKNHEAYGHSSANK